jgi:hypothetical protein
MLKALLLAGCVGFRLSASPRGGVSNLLKMTVLFDLIKSCYKYNELRVTVLRYFFPEKNVVPGKVK